MTGALLYRIAARALYAPFGGLNSIRRRILEVLNLLRGEKVLELGCGPGEITALLTARGAIVHAVGASSEMLREASAKASDAVFVRADVRHYKAETKFDAVILAFVLHEIPVTDIPALLKTAAANLTEGGRVVIADYTLPEGVSGKIWRRILHTIESPSVDAWLRLDVASPITNVGLVIRTDEELVGGRVRLLSAYRRNNSEQAMR